VAGLEFVEADEVRRSPFRVAVTPLPSLNSALRDSVGRPRGGTPAAWREAIRKHLRPGDYATLAPFATPGKTLVPDPLIGLSDPPGESFAEAVERLVATPLDFLAEEIAVCKAATRSRAWRDAERDPERWLRRYVASLLRAWKGFGPIWRQARPGLARERERLALATALDAQLELLDGLIEEGAVENGQWCVRCDYYEGRLEFPEAGLVLVPLVAGESSSVIVQSGGVVASIAYPARSPGAPGWTSTSGAPLEALLGIPRAQILRAVRVPTSIGSLAELLRAVPSAATHHVGALEAAGLVTRARRGRNVLVRSTTRGEALLELYAEADGH
jgi:DNA-binding transcriptional ArsR family regulator